MSIFSKLFKKNTNTNFNLINLNDIIIFPKKEFYKENKEKYKEYMDTYNQILSSKKYITSLDLEINNSNNIKILEQIAKFLYKYHY